MFQWFKNICTVNLVLFSSTVFAQTKVIGYLPGYQDIKTQVDQIDLTKISHLTLAFLHPNKDGVFIHKGEPTCMVGKQGQPLSSSELHYTVNKVHQAGKKVLISVGGAAYPMCAGNWATLLKGDNRQSTIKNLLHFIERYQLDGIDIDIEGQLLTQIDQEGNFVPFVAQLSQYLINSNKQLSAATGSYKGGMVPVNSIKYFDFVSIMSYDAIGPTWGPAGDEHSTLQKAKADIKLWKNKGLSKDKIILGLPFYGYGFGQYKAEYRFREILEQFGEEKSHQDLINTNCADCDYITFNGYQTIKAKTKLALEEAGGVMIWELSHDQHDQNGLLYLVDKTIKHHK